MRRLLRSRGFGVAVAALACTLLALNPDVRDLLRRGASGLSWPPLFAVVAIQVASLALCGVALRCVGPDLRLRDCLLARWLRDAGGNLLVLLPDLGELAGVRGLALLGVAAPTAVGAMALDTLAESAAQIPYAALALLVSPRLRGALARPVVLAPGAVFTCLAVAAAVLVVTAVVILRGRASKLGRLGRFLRETAESLRRGGRGLWAGGGLHLVAWVCGGLQVWAAAALMGLSLLPADALALESLVYVGRGLAFFAPAGLGVQEAGFVLGGAVFGLPAPAALSLSLLLRCRDLIVGAPALAAWLGTEVLSRRAGPQRARPDALAVPGRLSTDPRVGGKACG